MRDARAYDAGPDVQATARGDVAFLTTTVPDASRLDADGLRDDVARAYAKVGQALRTMGLYAVRWWNYLPDPGQMMAPGIDRYMVFNAGRHEGFRSFDRGANGHALATASAVGAATDDLAIHCLASGAVGHAVENPRQTPAWRYSPRYGPVPPSFSRATIAELDGRRLLLVGGTASVVGEDSMHAGDPEAQLEETFRNLAALVSTACRREEPPPISLARMKDLRVYLVRAEYASGVEALLRTRCPRASQVEVVPATLCRRELLIELEGIAEM
jgi:chorismate lyase/3-hydroxybenzoate synthase